MFNKVILAGNLTRDVELRYSGNSLAIGNTAIATNRKYKTSTGEQKEDIMFMDITFFGRSAEVANQYLKKGSKVLVEGRLIFDQWVDQNGQKRNKHSLTVETMQMLGNKADATNEDNSTSANNYSQPNNAPQNSNHNNNSSYANGNNSYQNQNNSYQSQDNNYQNQDNGGYKASYQDNQQAPVQNQYGNNSNTNNQYSNNQNSQQQTSPQQRSQGNNLPVIDIDDDEIPF
jgi:single-strand DNA-binding protein